MKVELSYHYLFLISSANSLKTQRSATLIHTKYTRGLLKYKKIWTKFQKLIKIKNRQTIPRYSSCIKRVKHHLLISNITLTILPLLDQIFLLQRVLLANFLKMTRMPHWVVIQRILRYLKGSPRRGLLYRVNGQHLRIEGYTDADWVGSSSDRRSTTGYCIFLGSNLVTWKIKKQTVVPRSSANLNTRQCLTLLMSLCC